MRICSVCVLPETYPGISFNSQGTCSYCQGNAARKDTISRQKVKYELMFQNLLDRVVKRKPSAYDAILAYSGGKDSTYTLALLRQKYEINVLAITFDHGFISDRAIKNIQAVTERLDVDHLFVRPSGKLLCRVFRDSISTDLYPMTSLVRASSICNTCMGLAKSLFLKYAVQMRIPLIAYGWSPGQAPVQASVMKLSPSLIRKTQEVLNSTLGPFMGDNLRRFTLDEPDFETMEACAKTDSRIFHYNVHPLAFLEYSEEQILREIEKLDWILPDDTDANSSNCLLNGFANQAHVVRYGFHPYAFEIANLVRGGHLSREAGLAKLSKPLDERIVSRVKKRLETHFPVFSLIQEQPA